jgi:hypothetical protein
LSDANAPGLAGVSHAASDLQGVVEEALALLA